MGGEGNIDILQKIVPSADVLASHNLLGAVRIIKAEQIGLRPDGRRPETGGMIRIAFNFDGTAFTTCYDDSLRITIAGGRGGEVKRFARNHSFRLLYVRNDFLDRLLCARADSGECERSAG